MEKLSDGQLSTFDTEYVTDRRWAPVQRCIDRDFPDGRFSLLDVGGGNGLFADRVLARYPNASAVVLDSAAVLLDKNVPCPRKSVLNADVGSLERAVQGRFDVICFNWLLHHLVSRSYSESRENILRTLRTAAGLLTERGRFSIYENMYEGLLVRGAPSRLVYWATSSKLLAALARRGGANTAGVGVCFLSEGQWRRDLGRSGLTILDYAADDQWQVPLVRRVVLHIGSIRCGHFWARACERGDAATAEL